MKKILFAFVLMLTLAFSVSAQTTVEVNPDSAGFVEQYPAIAGITYDTTVTYDTVGDVVDTITNITEDTTFVPNFYDYRAVAYTGYTFDRWEVTTTFNKWYDWDDSTGTTIEIDSIYTSTITQYNIEYDVDSNLVDYEGWLEWDGGIPDLNDTTIEDISSIVITAYFTQDTTPVGIGEVTPQSYHVYPNPTTGTINVLGDVHWITVYDMSGRVVTSTDAPVINLQGWPNGTYLVRVTDTKGNMGITKVIKR
jgi:hypothetical protein